MQEQPAPDGPGLHNFDLTNGRLPAAIIHSGRYNNASNRPYEGPEVSYRGQPYVIYNHSGFVALLPYIEQDNLFHTYNYGYRASASSPYGIPVANQLAANDNVAAQTIKIYNCPSDVNPPPVESRNPGSTTEFYEMVSASRSNYLFSTGAYTDYDADWKNTQIYARGAFGNNGAISISNVTDGTSNTIGIGESLQKWHNGSTVFGPYWGTGTHTAVHGRGYYSNFTPNYPYGDSCRIPTPLGAALMLGGSAAITRARRTSCSSMARSAESAIALTRQRGQPSARRTPAICQATSKLFC